MDAPLAACLADEVEHVAVLLVGDLQHGVVGGAPYGEDGEEAPVLDALRYEIVAQLGQLTDVLLVDARHHIVLHVAVGHQQVYRLVGLVEAVGMAAQPVVAVFQPV